MNEPTPEDLLARIKELEAQNARLKFERDMYKGPAYERFFQLEPYVPLTAAEAEALMNEPPGESIESILEEYEARYRDRL